MDPMEDKALMSQKENIEDTIFYSTLPVNTIAMLNRLKEILQDANVNCAKSLEAEQREKYLRVLWMLNQQVYGPTAIVHMLETWEAFYENEKKKRTIDTPCFPIA